MSEQFSSSNQLPSDIKDTLLISAVAETHPERLGATLLFMHSRYNEEMYRQQGVETANKFRGAIEQRDLNPESPRSMERQIAVFSATDRFNQIMHESFLDALNHGFTKEETALGFEIEERNYRFYSISGHPDASILCEGLRWNSTANVVGSKKGEVHTYIYTIAPYSATQNRNLHVVQLEQRIPLCGESS